MRENTRTQVHTVYHDMPSYFYNVCTVYRSNVSLLALYSFNRPEPKCITQSKMQRSQINFAKEPKFAPEPQKWTTLFYSVWY